MQEAKIKHQEAKLSTYMHTCVGNRLVRSSIEALKSSDNSFCNNIDHHQPSTINQRSIMIDIWATWKCSDKGSVEWEETLDSLWSPETMSAVRSPREAAAYKE